MLAKPKIRLFFSALALFLGFSLAMPAPLMAQFFNDGFDQDEYIESDDDVFTEDSDTFGTPRQEDFSEGGKFVDEERTVTPTTKEAPSITSRKTEIKIEGERQQLPLNAAWGAGTGLLIGGWFALIEGEDDRTTKRIIGMGVVLGSLLGVFLGMKTLIVPGAPSTTMAPLEIPMDLPEDMLVISGASKSEPLRIGYAFKF